MRPIDKFPVGHSIILDDGTKHIIQEEYRPYQEAKDLLCANFGQYCVYCEAPITYSRDLAVEHILPKDDNLGYSHLQYKWDNFLLACSTCNGAGNKWNNVAKPEDCHYPHLNNTFLSLKYDRGGVVIVNPDLKGKSELKARRLLNLVKLDKTPATSSPQDKRWEYRKRHWDIAEKYRARYEAGKLNLDCLVDYIKATGCWSIWFTVFEGHDEVRRRLIEDFPGTSAACFDAENHYSPIERNPGLEDPV